MSNDANIPVWCPRGTERINGELVYKNSRGQHLVWNDAEDSGLAYGWNREYPLIQTWLFDV